MTGNSILVPMRRYRNLDALLGMAGWLLRNGFKSDPSTASTVALAATIIEFHERKTRELRRYAFSGLIRGIPPDRGNF